MTATIHELLRDAMSQRYGGNMTRLAEACGVPVQSVSQWTADRGAKRRVPGPANCQKIARGLNLDADYVLQLAGHRPTASDASSVDLAHSELDARLARLSHVLGRYPRAFWAVVLDAYERMAQVGEVLEGPVNATTEGGVNAADAALTRDSHDPPRHLATSQTPIRGALTAALASR